MADTEVESSIKELGDKLAGLTLKQAVELGKYMKDAYGIEAAAGGGGGAAAPVAAAPKAEEKTSFDVILKAAGDKKIQVIKVVREITGLGLAEAKAFVDNPGKAVKSGLEKPEADKLMKLLQENGATVELA